jgi:hypothetical protein
MRLSARENFLATLCWGALLGISACDAGQPEPTKQAESTQSLETAVVECGTDADCRTFADYCEGCNCRALPVCAKDPVCKGTPVSCFANPCLNQKAVCKAGRCELASAGICPLAECGPPLGLPNRICPDGKSTAGPTGRCLRQPGGGCGWEIAQCPKPCGEPPSVCSTVLCPPGTRCVEQPVVCVRAPCPPIPRCVPITL